MAHQLGGPRRRRAREEESDGEGVDGDAVAEARPARQRVRGARGGGGKEQGGALPHAGGMAPERAERGALEVDETGAAGEGEDQALDREEQEGGEALHRPLDLERNHQTYSALSKRAVPNPQDFISKENDDTVFKHVVSKIQMLCAAHIMLSHRQII